MMPSIFSFTHDAFCQYIKEKLGKGFDHASIIYRNWFKNYIQDVSHPHFSNCRDLFYQIIGLVDFSLPKIVEEKIFDVTKKILIQTHDSLSYESVIIPMKFGTTLCVSSQVGCKMGCTFCQTGKMGLLRNLTKEEIVVQLFLAKFIFKAPVRNIVFMGMGEPLDNFDEVSEAVKILTDTKGFGIAKSHLTISTSGRVDGIMRLINCGDLNVNLAVSVNASTDEKRKKIMPVTRKYSMNDLKQAMMAWSNFFKKQILVEYVMIKDFNDSQEDAEQLGQYLNGLNVKVNLIPYNNQSDPKYLPSEEGQIQAFANRMRLLGYLTLWRQPKGRDIQAACGQLGSLDLKKRFKIV
jgi:23S rRNA (adenine2503-C2)-methyltransferase